MSLPTLIERLLAIQHPPYEAPLKNYKFRQSANVAAGQTVQTAVTIAPTTIYGFILYRIEFSPIMVPNAFRIQVGLRSSVFYFDEVDANLIAHPLDMFQVGRNNDKLQIRWQNQSLMQQNYEYLASLVVMPSEQDFKDTLEKIGNLVL